MFCLRLVFGVLTILGRLLWVAVCLYCYWLLGVLCIGGCASRGVGCVLFWFAFAGYGGVGCLFI